MADFSTLAQIARPTMMPEAPLGAGGLAGQAYGQDQVRYMGFLARAAEEAKVRAAMEAIKAEELALGRPGRLSDIRTKNAMSADTEEDYAAHGKSDRVQKRVLEELKNAEGFLRAIGEAEDVEEVKDIASNADVYGNTIIKGRDLKTLPPEALLKIGKAYAKATSGAIKHRQAMELEETKGKTKLTVEYMKQIGANTRAEQKTLAAAALAKLKLDKPTDHTIVMEYAKKHNVDPFEALLKLKAVGVIQTGQNTVDQANAILPKDKQMPDARVAPALTTAPKKEGPKLGDMWGTPKGDKKILGIKRDKDGNITHLNVEGVGVVEYK